MKGMCVKVNETDVDTNNVAHGLQGSFVDESDTKDLSTAEWEDMENNWVDIKEDPDVLNSDIDKPWEEMEEAPTAWRRALF